MSETIAAIDIGGTHARFALATLDDDKIGLGPVTTLATADHADLPSAWTAFAATLDQMPRAAAVAVAAPVGGETLRFTNSPWSIRPSALDQQLGLDGHVLINDFAAVAQAVTVLGDADLRPLCGPETPLPLAGVVTVLGPGTGLGVAALVEGKVIATEGGHGDFAPLDAIEDAILARLRAAHGRVSMERVVAGPGLATIHRALAEIEGKPIVPMDDRTLWAAALADDDPLAAAALERFCRCLGAVAGDLALAQGAGGVAIAGGLGLRLAERLPASGFAARFRAKGRFEAMMTAMPVKLVVHPEPGLLGAAAAWRAARRP